MGAPDIEDVDNPALRNKAYVFKDRMHAGTLVADELKQHTEQNMVLLALPGGVTVGYGVSKRLGIPWPSPS